MPTYITTISDEELVIDLLESAKDAEICKQALSLGLTTYGGEMSVQERLDRNTQIVGIITTELERRGIHFDAIMI